MNFAYHNVEKIYVGAKKLSKVTFEIFGEVFTKQFENPAKAKFFLKCLKIANLDCKPVPIRLAVSQYLKNVSSKKSKDSLKGDIRILNKFNLWLKSKNITHLTHIKPEKMDAYQRHLLDHYKSTSVNRHFNTLKHFLKKCEQWEYIPNTPSRFTKALKEDTAKKKLWTIDNYNALKNSLEGDYRVILEVLWLTGCRVSSAVNLKPENINIDNKTIFFKSDKGSKTRQKIYTVPYPNGFKIKKHNLPVSISAGAFLKKAGREMKKLGLDLEIHGIRHTFASQLSSRGAPIHIIAELLGHSNIKVTEGYIQNNLNALRKYLQD